MKYVLLYESREVADAKAVFTTRAAAEEFASKDPFVTRDVVGGWSVKEWNEAIGPEQAGADR